MDIKRLVFLLWALALLASCSTPDQRASTETSDAAHMSTPSPADIATTAATTSLPSTLSSSTPELRSTPIPTPDRLTTLVSLSPEEKPVVGGNAHLSADDRYVVFLGRDDIYLRDLLTDETTSVNEVLDGRLSEGQVAAPKISGDGQTLAFFSNAPAIVENPYEECPEQLAEECGSLYIIELPTNEIERIAVAVTMDGSLDVALSADGRRVAFAVPGGFFRRGVYLYDRATQTLTPISAGDTRQDRVAPDTDTGGYLVDISGNGRYVAFASDENSLVANDMNDVMDVFVYDHHTEHIERISKPLGNGQSNYPSGFQSVPNAGGARETGLAISADGRHVVFMSAANLVNRELPACLHWHSEVEFPHCRHIYLYDRESGQMELISVSSGGVPGNKASEDAAVSADGRWVVFTSLADNLVDNAPGECNFPLGDGSCPQVYLRDRQEERTYLVSRGWQGQLPDGASFNSMISSSGRYATFTSYASNMTPLSPAPDAGSFGERSRAYITDLSGLCVTSENDVYC